MSVPFAPCWFLTQSETICSQFSLVTVVLFYKIISNTELAHTGPLFLQEQLIRTPPLRPYLTLITFLDAPAPNMATQEVRASTHGFWRTQAFSPHHHIYFLHKALYSFLALSNTTQQLSTILGGHFKQKNHQHKTQKHEKSALHRPRNEHLFAV